MTDKPILFSGPMIRALLDGRKTQTRRVLKPPFPGADLQTTGAGVWTWWDTTIGKPSFEAATIPYAPGDRLWVREAHWFTDEGDCVPVAGNEEASSDERKRPSIYMPRWASRLTLTITDVRVQRVQDIRVNAVPKGASYQEYIANARTGLQDACDEGLIPHRNRDGSTSWSATPDSDRYVSPTDAFVGLWDSLNAKRGYGWNANPWVIALTFDVHRQNIDQMEASR